VDDLVDSTAQRVKEELPDRAAQLSDTVNTGAAQVRLLADDVPAYMRLLITQLVSFSVMRQAACAGLE
jgi:hypothetical protein